MNVKLIEKEVKEIVETKDAKRAFFFYKEVINHLNIDTNWNEFTLALRPLVDLYKSYGENNNYGYSLTKSKYKKKHKHKSKHKNK